MISYQVDAANRPLAEKDARERYFTEYAELLDGSPQTRAIRTAIENIADTDATISIRGESGVGKDLVAQALRAGAERLAEHGRSLRGATTASREACLRAPSARATLSTRCGCSDPHARLDDVAAAVADARRY